MRGFFISLLFFSFAAAIYGETAYSAESVKQLFLSAVNNKVTPSNSASCSDASSDFENKCTKNYSADCKGLQDLLNCAWDVAYKDCGNSKAKDFCNQMNAAYPVPAGCTVHCSASSIFITGSIGALLLYKMLLEKLFF